jgi:hypothetical protein
MQSLIRRVMRGPIALLLLSCSSSPQEAGPDRAEADYTIKRILAQIDAGWFSDPDEPVARLAAFGREGLPILERSRASAKPAAGNALQRAIARIHATDPFFLVRAPDRRVTARLKSASRAEAYTELFKGFPIHPHMPPQLEFSHPVPKVAVWLSDATYWEAVRAFCQAFDVELNGELFEESRSSAWSRPFGACIVSANGAGRLGERTLTVRLHLEPGIQPIDGSIHSLKLTDAAGRRIPGLVESDGNSFMKLTGNRRDTTVGTTQIRWATGGRDHGSPLTLTGLARVVLPVEIESTIWLADDWDQDPVRTLGPCRIEFISLDPFRLRHTSPEIPKAAGADAYRDHAWVFISDDEGRSVNNSGFGLGGGGAIAGANWPNDTPYKRVTVVRPMKAEVVEFPFEIKGIRLP